MRTRQLAAGLALLGMVAAGCATPSRPRQPTPSQPGQALTAARGKTLGARTARFRGTVTVDGRQTIRIDGVIDFARSASQQTQTMAGLPGATTTIYLPDVTYTKDPRNTPKGAKPWLKVKVGPAAKQTGMTPFGVADPRRALDFLYGVSRVTDLGTQVVRGTPTRHWRATVTLADMVAAEFHEQRATVLAELGAEGLGAEAATPVPVDVWVDDQGRVRKVVNTFPSTTADRRGGGTITIEYFDFGAPVRIVLPPASQVVEDHY
jgi:hypothetical protein